MKKYMFLALIGLLLSAPTAQAQLYGNCSMFLCKEKVAGEQGTNLVNLFTGYKSSAVGKNNTFTIFTIFQGYEPNKVHSSYSKLVQVATGKIIGTMDKYTFTLKNIVHSLHDNAVWTVNFPETGLYVITTYVDDKVAQKLYFEVGN